MALATSLTLAAFGIVTPLDREMDEWLEQCRPHTVPQTSVTEVDTWEHEALDSLKTRYIL